MRKTKTSFRTGKPKNKPSSELLALPLYFGLLALTLPLASQADSAAVSHNQRFNIAPQPLYSALNRLAEQSGVQFVYSSEMVKGLDSPGVSGNYSLSAALSKLLAGSGLGYQLGQGNTVTLQNWLKPVAATQSAGPQSAAYLPTVKVTGNSVVDSGEQTSLTAESKEQSQQRLNAVPGGTTLLDGERIRETASYSVSDTLSYTPGLYATTGTGGFVGGGSRISMRGSDINSAISPILGVKALRDGMPITTANGATDTESINLYAIDRVEVYRGANAMQYGAAQLGGAINMISPTGYTSDGVRLGMTAGSFGFINPTFSAGKVFDNGFDAYGSFAYAEADNFRKNAEEQHVYGYGNIGYRWNDRKRLTRPPTQT